MVGARDVAAKFNQWLEPFDFGITMGDKFYLCGVRSVNDPKWKTRWEDMYSPLGIPFYAALGNHDYGKARKTDAAKDFLKKNYYPYHIMPYAPGSPHYYYFDTANARFIVLDTNSTDDAKWAPPITPASPRKAK